MKQLIRKLIPRSLHRYHRATQDFVRFSNGVVKGGPFEGQVSITSKNDFVDPEMLLGIYELEIHAIIEEIVNFGYDQFVDVGSAQGYYVIGMARRCPNTTVVGFEMSLAAIEQCKHISKANGVQDQIELCGECTAKSLSDVLKRSERSCVLMDVDGYEEILLDPDKVPELQKTSLLVEEHSFMIRGLLKKCSPALKLLMKSSQLPAESVLKRIFPFDQPPGSI